MNNTTKKDKPNNKDLIKKYEMRVKKEDFSQRKEMYLRQTDRNYKDGDKN